MRTPVSLLFTLISLLLAGQVWSQTIRSRSVGDPSWDRSLVVKTTEAKFGDELLPSYMITIYDASDKDISKYWKDYLKSRGGKVKTRGGMQAEEVVMSDLTQSPISILTAFEPGADNSTHMHLAIIQDSVAINPDDHPEMHEKIMPTMQNLSIEMNKAVVAHQIEVHEETLEGLQKDLEKLQKENESLRNDITKNKDRIQKTLQDISDSEADLAGANTSLEVYTAKESPTTSDMKTIDKLRKQIDKLNSRKAKDEQSITEYEAEIQKAEAAIPFNEEEQERLKAAILEQQELVETYRQKQSNVGN
jgi:vacuolar-type H+-ATPase subunit I/STV1